MDTSSVIVLGIVLAAVVLPVAVVISLRLPWLPLALFWVLPNIKLWLRVYVPVSGILDPTVMTGILVVCVIVISLLSQRKRPRCTDKLLLSTHAALGLLMLVTLLWTTAPEYGSYKAMRFAVFSTMSLVGPMLLLNTAKQAKRMGQALVVLGLGLALLMLFSPGYEIGARWELRQTALGASPLNPAFVMAVAAVLAATSMRESGMLFRLVNVVSTPIMLVAIYRTGSRAMFAQVFLGIAIWALISRSSIRWGYRIALAAVIVLAPVLLEIVSEGATTRRIKLFVEAPVETLLSSDRMTLWSFVLAHAHERPIVGHGTGSFAVDALGEDRRDFPHNLFLEALYEQGSIGLLLLTAFTAVPIYRYLQWRFSRRRNRGNPLVDVWFAASLSGLLAVLPHWDLADIRLVWFLFAVLVTLCLLERQTLAEEARSPQMLEGACRRDPGRTRA